VADAALPADAPLSLFSGRRGGVRDLTGRAVASSIAVAIVSRMRNKRRLPRGARWSGWAIGLLAFASLGCFSSWTVKGYPGDERDSDQIAVVDLHSEDERVIELDGMVLSSATASKCSLARSDSSCHPPETLTLLLRCRSIPSSEVPTCRSSKRQWKAGGGMAWRKQGAERRF
jgi:hypothetical protein